VSVPPHDVTNRPRDGDDEIVVTPEMMETKLNTLYQFPITETYENEMRKAVASVLPSYGKYS
jgi:hypothetical protein